MKVLKTTYAEMGSVSGSGEEMAKDEIVAYLIQNVQNAVVLISAEREVAIFCGAAEDERNYFVQERPLEDPNDAEGGDFTAEEAVQDTISWRLE